MNPQIVVLVIGVLCILGGIFLIRKGNKLKKRCTEKTLAKVIDVEVSKQSREDGGDEYRPVVSFNYDGKDYSGQIGIVTKSRKAYKVGDTMDVLFDPNDPSCFIDAKRNVSIRAGIVFILVGIFFIVLVPFVSA